MAASPAWQEQDNCFRCCKLTLNGGGYFCKQLLLQETVNNGSFIDLDIFLAAHKITITSLKARRIVKDTQYLLMFPLSGTPTDLEQWDITLVTLILTSCVTLNQGHKDAIRDIRDLRNNVHGHTVHLAMTEPIFQTTWADISSTLRRISPLLTDRQCQIVIVDMIASIEHEVLSSDKVVETLTEWYQTDKKVEEMIEGLSKKIGSLEEKIGGLSEKMGGLKDETVGLQAEIGGLSEKMGGLKEETGGVQEKIGGLDEKIGGLREEMVSGFTSVKQIEGDVGIMMHLLRKILSTMENQQCHTVDQMKLNRKIAEGKVRLETHMSGLGKLHIDHKTRLTKIAVDLLQSNNIVVIQGKPGNGKSHIALNVLKEFTDAESSFQFLVFCEPTVKEVEEIMDISKKYILIFDDFLGRINIETTILSEWNRYITTLKSYIQSGKVFVVIAVRNNIRNKCSNENINTIFNMAWTLDVDETVMNVDEKRDMLTNYAEHLDVDISKLDINKVINEDIHGVGFPLLCCVMKGKNVLNLFARPVEVLTDDIMCLPKKDNASFICLLMTMFCNEMFNISRLCERDTLCFEQIKTYFGQISLNEYLMQEAAHSMLRTYLRIKDDNCYSFVHNTILEATFKAAMVLIPEILIQFCPLNIMVTFSNSCLEQELINEHETQRTSSLQHQMLLKRLSDSFLSVKFAKDIKVIAGSSLWKRSEFIQSALQAILPEVYYQEDDSEKSLVVYFAGFGHLEIIKEIENTINEKPSLISFSKKNKQNKKAMQEACLCAKQEVVKYLISSKTLITEESMFAAVQGGNVEVLGLLQDAGGNVKAQRKNTGENLLHEVVKYICSNASSLIHMDDKIFTVRDSKAEDGHFKCLRYLLKQGVDPLATSSDGRTVLHIASGIGHLNIVEYLCNKYPSLIHMKNNENLTVAHYAANRGHLECLQYLIEQGVNLMPTDSNGPTVLHISSQFGHLKVVEYLCSKYSSLIHIKDNKNWTAAHYAAEKGHLECLQYLIEQGVDPMSTSSYGHTVLHTASRCGQLKVVDYLCNTYSGWHHMKDNNNWTVAHYAAGGGHLECLQYLIEQGVDPMSTTTVGRTVLHIASQCGHLKMVEYLSKTYSSLIHMKENNNLTVAHYAAYGGHLECLQCLIERGINPMSTSSNSRTVLHIASEYGHLKVVEYLYNKYSSLIHMKDNNNWNVAHFAAYGGHLECLQYLIEQGVNPMSTSFDGRTVLHIASQSGHLNILEYLCNKYSNLIPMKNNSNYTAVHDAAAAGQLECLVYFIKLGRNAAPKRQNIILKELYRIAERKGNIEIFNYLSGVMEDIKVRKCYIL